MCTKKWEIGCWVDRQVTCKSNIPFQDALKRILQTICNLWVLGILLNVALTSICPLPLYLQAPDKELQE